MRKREQGEFFGKSSGMLRVTGILWVILGGIYSSVLLGIGRMAAPSLAEGSLIRNESGTVIGSLRIAQRFSQAHYFWPRPSAVDYQASAAGGSNLPPASPELARQVRERISLLGGSAENPVPIELLAASGSGLDPHVTYAAAVFQAGRVSSARGLDPASLLSWLAERKSPLINVLSLNIALDERFGPPPVAGLPGRKEPR